MTWRLEACIDMAWWWEAGDHYPGMGECKILPGEGVKTYAGFQEPTWNEFCAAVGSHVDLADATPYNMRFAYRWYLTNASKRFDVRCLDSDSKIWGGFPIMAVATQWILMSSHRQAAKGLQRTLNDQGVAPQLEVDGWFGAHSLAAYRHIDEAARLALLTDYATRWLWFLEMLNDRDPQHYGQFINGWRARVEAIKRDVGLA